MRSTIRGARSAVLGGLSGATLAGALASVFITPALAYAPPPGTLATVGSTAAAGIRFVGSEGQDQVVLSRAGTATAPLVVIDAFAPLTIQSGCQPVAGDPTRAICAAPIASGSTLRPVVLLGNGGDDLIAHGASLPIPMVVDGGAGRDGINGGPGQDTIDGGGEDDVLRAGDGTDMLTGSAGDDQLDGGSGRDDNLFGGSGADTLLGGAGDSDDLDGGTGPDILDGGPGRLDVVRYDTRTARVRVVLGSTTATNGEADEGDLFKTGIENVVGGAGDDYLLGDNGGNNLLGGDGADIILGSRGQDAVIGGDGDDLLTGNLFAVQFGGPPPANADGARDVISGRDGTDACVRSPADNDSVTECEKVTDDD